MAAPTNTDATTATPLGNLPATATQRVDDAGTTYTVWYSFVAPSDCVVVNCFSYGDATVYLPDTSLFIGPASAPVPVGASGSDNKPILQPVTAGETYYIRSRTNGGNPSPANLTLNVQAAPNDAVVTGSIGVNDDNANRPLVFYSVTTGDVLRYKQPFPSSDFCDTLPSGYILALDSGTDVWTLYDPLLNVVGHPAIGTGYTRVSSNQHDLFYVAKTSGTVKTVTIGLTVATVANIGASIWSMAPAPDDSILYYVSTNGTNQAIKRWDLNTDMAMADLAAGIVGYTNAEYMIVLTDGTILVAYRKTTATKDIKTLQYSAAGATLHTFTYGAEATTATLNQVQHAINDTTEFWSWLFLNDVNATFEYRKIKISDGSTLVSVTAPDYTGGSYLGVAIPNPERFGNSSSCQMFIMRGSVTPTPTTTYPIRRQRRFLLPSSPDNTRVTIPWLELLMRTGIGLLPDATGSSTPLGVDPQVMFRISKDGGKTWSNERWVSGGTRGRYSDRVRLRGTGNYRNAVLEVTVDAPVDWQMVAMLGEPVEGSS